MSAGSSTPAAQLPISNGTSLNLDGNTVNANTPYLSFAQNPTPFAMMASQNSMVAQTPASSGVAPWQQLPQNFNMMTGWNPQLMAALTMASQMSTPVGGDKDEEILIRVLSAARLCGKSFKQAIDSELHGVNNHAANLWKDHFLDNHERIYAEVVKRSKAVSGASRESSLQSSDTKPKTFRRPDLASPGPASSSSPARPSYARRHSPPTAGSHVVPSRPKPRQTLNSITAPVSPGSLPSDRRKSRHLYRDVKDPSRSPSPPRVTEMISHGRARFTEEDHDFFLKCLKWEMKKDPSLGKTAFCTVIARKAPHHSEASWLYYWNTCGKLPDRVVDAARGDAPADGADNTDESAGEQSSSESEQEEEDFKERRKRFEKVAKKTDDSPEPTTEDDERQMGGAGTALTGADFRTLARHIARTPNFNQLKHTEQWMLFEAKHPQRSYKSWAEAYRRNRSMVDHLSAKFRMRARPTTPVKPKESTPQASVSKYEEYLSRKRKPLSDPGTDAEDDLDTKRMREDE